MKKSSLVVLVLLFVCLTSSADTDTDNGVSMGRGHHRGKNSPTPNKNNKNPSIIRGNCSIIESSSNPFPGPCVDALIILQDVNRNELARGRTTAKGAFEFTADRSKTYYLASGSRYFDVVAPKDSIQGGNNIELKLQQK